MADINSKVYVGITSCIFTPTGKTAVPITDVLSIEKVEGGAELSHHVDNHRWATWEDEVDASTSIVVNLKTLPSVFLSSDCKRGSPGTLVWTCTARNPVGGKDRVYTAALARLLHLPSSALPHAEEATGAMAFAVWSNDGDTAPVAVADAT
jgi:hypothetical protein